MIPGPSTKLSPTDLANHHVCRHRTQLRRQVDEGTLKLFRCPDARLDAMFERGLRHEEDYITRLRSQGLGLVDLRDNRDAASTLQAMQTGVDAIVQAPLGDAEFTGIADVLLRTAKASQFGAYSYEPVDTKLAAETKAGALLQLLTYCALLESMQGVRPDQFYVVTPAKEQPEIYRTADYNAYYRAVREHLLAERFALPAPATYPDPVAFCEVCEFRRVCEERRTTDDHPSLIANIQASQTAELHRQGLPTLAAIARSRGALPEKPKRGRRETYERIAHQARLQLEARETKKIPVEILPIEPGRGFCRLPTPNAGDVFLDFEGDPFVGKGGIEYLTGYAYLDAKGNPAYQSLWALDRTAERAAVEQFLDLVASRLAQHAGMHVYHYGAYEVAALDRLRARYDTRGVILDGLLRGQRFVDLLSVVREGMRIGVDSYSLKQIEKVAGFSRELELDVAGKARCDLELALELECRDRITEDMRTKVEEYNRDDCMATLRLRDWLEEKRKAVELSGSEVPRPPLGTTKATPRVTARDARVAGLRAALEQGLPAPEQRNPEDRARALLGSLVGYFHREERSAWGDYFRRREMPPEDHFDEREILAELQAVAEERSGKKVRVTYQFPAQECGIGTGDDLYFLRNEDPDQEGPGSKVGKVADIDINAGRLVIEQSAGSPQPTAVLRRKIFGAAPQESALFAFGDHVAEHGLAAEGAFELTQALLLQQPPRLQHPTSGSLQRPDEDNVAAAIRICLALDGGILPIQGPPGTGKSHTGSRVIAELIRAGKRVGITAVGHEVIDNLLKKVGEAAAEKGLAIRLVHKDDGPDRAGIEFTDSNETALAAARDGAVVGATSWLWSREDAINSVDYLFVDEAGQMALASVLTVTRAATNLVLLGDPQQLEQPHKGSHPDGADISALSHLIGLDRATIDTSRGLFLAETRRMHPDVCRFTSEIYYDGKLHSHPDCARQRIDGTGLVDGAGLFLMPVEHTGNQAHAPEEVDAIFALVTRMLGSKASCTDKAGIMVPLTGKHILVVAPYNAQVQALRQRLEPLGVEAVGTVDKFQGKEAPIVIYSCTSSSPQDAPRGMAFLYDPHRLNVATSRAECVVVVVANPRLFRPEARTPEQMRWGNGMCRYAELAQAVRQAGS